MSCEICQFKNPRVTVTGIIIKANKLLLLKRNEEPFKDQWDLPGGFMQENESLFTALKRELFEELAISRSELTFIDTFAGLYQWKGKTFPILSHVFLVESKDEIVLSKENSDFKWEYLSNIENIAF